MPLDSSRLTSRLRDILRKHPAPAGASDEARSITETVTAGGASSAAGIAAPDESTGPVRELRYVPDDGDTAGADVAGGCVLLDRQYDPVFTHGPHAVSRYAETLTRCLPSLAVLAADPAAAVGAPRPRNARLQWERDSRFPRDDRSRVGAPTAGPLLFFDLETTGLSGGAGTLAFLVGCGYFEAAGFHTRQYFLSGYEAEHELLGHLAGLVSGFNGLVTFNGRTFDVPLIETRYLFHRLESPFASLPHFDMLQPARKLWRRRGSAGPSHRQRWMGGSPGEGASCSLGALEEAILGVQRFDDVPGFEIPGRYFHYLRTGDMAPLHAVFEHNRLDLLSLAAITAIAARLADEGPGGVPSPHEALAMGQIYERVGRHEDAEACLARAAGLGHAPWDAEAIDGALRADALRRLALHRRRARRYDDAAEVWQLMLDSGAAEPYAQEARCALAIHHEHRARDFDRARRVAERALASEHDPVEVEALRHRLARLDRKLGRRTP